MEQQLFQSNNKYSRTNRLETENLKCQGTIQLMQILYEKWQIAYTAYGYANNKKKIRFRVLRYLRGRCDDGFMSILLSIYSYKLFQYDYTTSSTFFNVLDRLKDWELTLIIVSSPCLLDYIIDTPTLYHQHCHPSSIDG